MDEDEEELELDAEFEEEDAADTGTAGGTARTAWLTAFLLQKRREGWRLMNEWKSTRNEMRLSSD